MNAPVLAPNYRGRLAPSPTGLLHLGHARTFWQAYRRAQLNHGTLILRNDDLDQGRCKPEFVLAMFEDLSWFGLQWTEGPNCGGPFGPYNQSERTDLYRAALEQLCTGGFIYACSCSRKDIAAAVRAPHAEDDAEPIYPGTCRQRHISDTAAPLIGGNQRPLTLRFRIPDDEEIGFHDLNLGMQTVVAGRDFGDFVVWRSDGMPAYQLACVVDDAAMKITEVVRGADLLKSTARQLLLYRALKLTPPQFYHCELMTDEKGQRLAKRHDALSLRSLRTQGVSPEVLRQQWI